MCIMNEIKRYGGQFEDDNGPMYEISIFEKVIWNKTDWNNFVWL